MFKKLLKHDMKAVWRLAWISTIVVPIATLVATVATRIVQQELNNDAILVLFATLSIGASYIALILSFVLTEILVMIRFYKNFFTDEGYLTFTLPAKRSTLLLSKTLSAVIFFTAHTLLFIGALCTYMLFAPLPESPLELIDTRIYESIWELFTLVFDAYNVWTIVIIIEAFALMLAIIVMNIALIQLSITIGSVIARKAKIIVSIGIYYAINTALTTFWQFMYIMFLMVAELASDVVSFSSTVQSGAAVAILMLIIISINAIVASLLYCFTQNLLDRRLNLA